MATTNEIYVTLNQLVNINLPDSGSARILFYDTEVEGDPMVGGIIYVYSLKELEKWDHGSYGEFSQYKVFGITHNKINLDFHVVKTSYDKIINIEPTT